MKQAAKAVASGRPFGPFPCRFLYILAGEQTEHAVNDKTFNEVTFIQKEQDNEQSGFPHLV